MNLKWFTKAQAKQHCVCSVQNHFQEKNLYIINNTICCNEGTCANDAYFDVLKTINTVKPRWQRNGMKRLFEDGRLNYLFRIVLSMFQFVFSTCM